MVFFVCCYQILGTGAWNIIVEWHAQAALPQSKHFSTPTHDKHYLETFLLGPSISHYDCQYLRMWAETQVRVARVGMSTLSSLDSIDMFRCLDSIDMFRCLDSIDML